MRWKEGRDVEENKSEEVGGEGKKWMSRQEAKGRGWSRWRSGTSSCDHRTPFRTGGQKCVYFRK